MATEMQTSSCQAAAAAKGRLPRAAYEALAALKDQARAVASMLVGGKKNSKNRSDLADAQRRMLTAEPWTRRITRALLDPAHDQTIETIDDRWLDEYFRMPAAEVSG